jgi:cytoskeletal protein RodZ
MQEILLTAGTAFVGAAIVGGGLQAFNIRIPVIDSPARQLMLGGFGGLLIAFALLQPTARSNGNGSEPAPNRTTHERQQTSPSSSGAGETDQSPSSEGSSASSNSPAGSSSMEGCVVTINNPVISLYEKPDRFSQEISRIPAGDYEVHQTTVTEHVSANRWLKIQVEGRTGWVPDDTHHIADKTSECP